ncbi:hypothetical protein VPH35_102068 [Triticum aestivum]
MEYGSYSPNLAWASRLRQLQVLAMSNVDLSSAAEWFHVINMLPYLTYLDLSACELPNNMPHQMHSNLTHLNQLYLSCNDFGGQPIPKLIGALRRLTHLDLSSSNFGGQIPRHLGNLSNLVSLDLSRMPQNAYSPDLTWVSSLTKLQVLIITEVDLSAAVHWTHAINMLPSLINLDLSSCRLHNTMPPPSHSNLTSLETLTLSGNSFNASLGAKNLVWDLPSLQALFLDDCGIDGPIPDAVGNLTSIQHLLLYSNKFTGTMPLTFKKLKTLQQLFLQDNFINMDVAELLHRLPSDALQELVMDNNNLKGSLPARLRHFNRLNTLFLDSNELSGEIPVGIRELKSLSRLSLSSNNLHGTITEGHFTNLTTLEFLLISENSLTVKVNSTWKPPFKLVSAGLRSCIVGPQFPAWLNQPTITYLDVSNTSIHDNIPVWIANSNTRYMDLSRNRLFGMLPTFSQLTQLEVLDVSSNHIVGPIPPLTNSLRLLDLSRNNLSGALPSDIGASKLEVLLLFDNSFSGTIPCSLFQLQYLLFLDLSKNLLNGTLTKCPQGLKTSNTTLVNLNNNRLSGAFPLFLQRCRKLQFLDLAYNKFSGRIPTWIASKLPQLAFLRLRSNMFSGGIPSQLTMMKGLQFLDISCNNISGSIPRSLQNLIAMTLTSNNSGGLFNLTDYKVLSAAAYAQAYTDSLLVNIKGQQLEYTKGIAYMVNIDFSCNSLTGQIPQEIGKLVALKNINFSWNSLTGIIPQFIGELHALESFDLSHNELSGAIPTSLSALTSLSHLNLSYNDLTGTIPSGNQLRTLEDQASIYIGNPGLCGPPLTRNCSRRDIITYAPQEHAEGMSDVVSLYLSMCLGFVLGLWVVFCGLLFKRKWRVCWFSLMDHIYDRAYVQVVVGWASLVRKIRQG